MAKTTKIDPADVSDHEFPMDTNPVTDVLLHVADDGKTVKITDDVIEFHAEDLIDTTTPLPLDEKGQVIVTEVEFPMPTPTPPAEDDREPAVDTKVVDAPTDKVLRTK